MSVSVRQVEDVTIVTVPGENLTAANSREVMARVNAQIVGLHKVAFDMRDVEFVDSSGLGTLLSCLRKIHEIGGELKLFGITATVRSLFELVRVHKVVDVLECEEDAVRAFATENAS